MELEFKPVVAGDIDRLRPFYGMRPNKTCDSVFLDSFLWKDYYHVQCAVSEGRAAPEASANPWDGWLPL